MNLNPFKAVDKLLPKDRNTVLIVNRHDLWGRMAIIIFVYGFYLSAVYTAYYHDWFGSTYGNVAIVLTILLTWTGLAMALAFLKLELNQLRLFPNPPPQNIVDQMATNPQGPYGASQQQTVPAWMQEPTARTTSVIPAMRPRGPSPFNTEGFGNPRAGLSPTMSLVQDGRTTATAIELDALFNHLWRKGLMEPDTLLQWSKVQEQLVKIKPLVLVKGALDSQQQSMGPSMTPPSHPSDGGHPPR